MQLNPRASLLGSGTCDLVAELVKVPANRHPPPPIHQAKNRTGSNPSHRKIHIFRYESDTSPTKDSDLPLRQLRNSEQSNDLEFCGI
jgi:hypothetical protein